MLLFPIIGEVTPDHLAKVGWTNFCCCSFSFFNRLYSLEKFQIYRKIEQIV